MQIVDTHQHLWDLELCSYAWTKNHTTLNRSFRMNDYLAAIAGCEVVKTVHLECDVDEPFLLQETQHLLRLAEQPDNPLTGVVAGCRPEHDDFKDYLAQIVGHPNLKGLRRVLHVVPDEVSQAPAFVPNLRLLEQYNLSFDLCVLARQLPLALRLSKECPGVQFILDHCGNPRIAENDLAKWRERIAEVAAHPNVVCKISGIITNASANWTAEELRPAVEHVIACFGWERVLFGSDWPVCTLNGNFKQWLAALLDLTKAAGMEKQRKLFQNNAERVYRLNE
jgi:predicted TIM-barrel fold metal-dependent hydrolase